MNRFAILAAIFATMTASPALAEDPLPPRVPNGLAQAPQMGWNSWNKFGCDIDEEKIRGVADAMASNDLRVMDEKTSEILLNKEIIAINQDTLGRAARRIWKEGGHEVWVRELADGSRAVALFNRGESPAKIGVGWPAMGYPSGIPAKVRDLWLHKDTGQATGHYETTVKPHSATILRITPSGRTKS